MKISTLNANLLVAFALIILLPLFSLVWAIQGLWSLLTDPFMVIEIDL
jgi:hypothetical protein